MEIVAQIGENWRKSDETDGTSLHTLNFSALRIDDMVLTLVPAMSHLSGE